MFYVIVSVSPALGQESGQKITMNTDKTAYQRYLQSKNQQLKFQDAVSDINNLKEEIFEIKTLLTEFLKKNGN